MSPRPDLREAARLELDRIEARIHEIAARRRELHAEREALVAEEREIFALQRTLKRLLEHLGPLALPAPAAAGKPPAARTEPGSGPDDGSGGGLEFRPHRNRLRADQQRAAERQDAIVAWLTETGPHSPGQIREHFKLTRSAMHRDLQTLAAAGRAVSTGRSSYTLWTAPAAGSPFIPESSPEPGPSITAEASPDLRQTILTAVNTLGSASRSEVAERCGVEKDAASYHLQRLARAGEIHSVGATAARRYYSHARYAENVATLGRPTDPDASPPAAAAAVETSSEVAAERERRRATKAEVLGRDEPNDELLNLTDDDDPDADPNDTDDPDLDLTADEAAIGPISPPPAAAPPMSNRVRRELDRDTSTSKPTVTFSSAHRPEGDALDEKVLHLLEHHGAMTIQEISRTLVIPAIEIGQAIGRIQRAAAASTAEGKLLVRDPDRKYSLQERNP